jgi:peptidoglycan/xylan/chitin deacetylase (PgdA/CDA1 family)
MLNTSLICIILSIAFTSYAQEKRITVTIDDVPCVNCESIETIKLVNNKIIGTLNKYNVPAIGFVNEVKVYTAGKVDTAKASILRTWLRNGYELGNHTYSHVSINDVTVEEYEDEILKGEQITKPLMREYGKYIKYFRHTQLRTGPTEAYKKKLDHVIEKHGYTVAPVTIDNDEYIYAYCYHKARQQKDSARMQLIADDYLAYMDEIIRHYENLSKDFLGYQVNQIMLLHANELNAEYLDLILELLKKHNFHFVSIDEALNDPAYKMKEGISPKGLSWINRWQIGKGLAITPQPSVSEKIRRLMEHYNSSK